MSNFNKVILMGHLTRDPELRYTTAGTPVANTGMAVNRSWTGADGNKAEEVTFVDVSLWGKTAENVAKYLSKGSPLHIDGRLKLDQWTDKETGQKRQKLGVVGEAVQFLGSGIGDQGDKPAQPDASGPSSSSASPPSKTATTAMDFDNEDDIPF